MQHPRPRDDAGVRDEQARGKSFFSVARRTNAKIQLQMLACASSDITRRKRRDSYRGGAFYTQCARRRVAECDVCVSVMQGPLRLGGRRHSWRTRIEAQQAHQGCAASFVRSSLA